MKKKLIILLLVIAPLSVTAQEVLSLVQCREMALENNKRMALAEQKTKEARYLQRSMKGNFFPNFSAMALDMYGQMDASLNIPGGNLPVYIGANPNLLKPSGFAYFPGIDLNMEVNNIFMGGVQVEQPIYMGRKVATAYRMTKIGTKIAQLNERLTASEVILETENAYALLVKAQEMSKVAESYHAVLDELLKVVESAHRHGLKPQNDVLKVQVKLNESELSIRRAENACRLARMNLCHLIGLPLNTPLEIDSVYPHVAAVPGQAGMISDRPEYGMVDRRVALAEERVRLTRSERLPKLGVRGSYSYMNGLKLNDQKLFNEGSFSMMVNLSVPIFHFGVNSGKMRAAKAQLEQARLEQEDLNEKMTLEMEQCQNLWDEARLEADLADRLLEQAEENRRLSKGQYAAGLETLSDHLESQALWQQAYATQVDARFQLYLSYVKYLKTIGQLQTEK